MLFVLPLLVSGLLAQEASSPVLPRPLKVSGAKQLEIPSFGTFGNTQCDEDSSMNDHLATGSNRHTEILRTSSSGNESTLYKLPEEFANTAFTDFSVSPHGDVTVLVERKGHFITFDFASDGNVSSHAELEVPEYVTGDHISVFPNGTRLFSGHYRGDAPSDLKRKRYVGLFQSSGKLLKRLDQLSDEIKEPQERHLPDGGITIGGDGNVYLLTSNKVLVISPSGQIQRKITFAKPDPDFSAVRVQYSESLIVVSFAKPGKPETLFQYLVVNASNGDTLGVYAPTAETGNNNVCFNRHDGFTFLKVSNNRLNIISARLR
jgi:hypothetical protein